MLNCGLPGQMAALGTNCRGPLQVPETRQQGFFGLFFFLLNLLFKDSVYCHVLAGNLLKKQKQAGRSPQVR